ncbi:MAG TPA: hypothetical protein VIF62_21305 [Labilithrix sp.]|jgi:hypothetical protein
MKRTTGFVAFAWTLTFCASPSQSPIVVAPVASGTSSAPIAISEAHAAPPPAVDTQLAKERLEAARRVVANNAQAYTSGSVGLDEVALWHEHLFRAQEDVLTGQALVDAARERVATLKGLETLAQRRVNAGVTGQAEIAKATYYRAGAEMDLARVSR